MFKTNSSVWNATKQLEDSTFNYLFRTIAGEIVFSLVFCTVLLIALTGNSLVIIMICSSRKLMTVFNLLILNMATADLLYGLNGLIFCGTYVYTFYISTKKGLGFGDAVYDEIVCQYLLSVTGVLSKVSVLTVAVISLERYLAIKCPLKHKSYTTKRKTQLIIATLWAISILFSMPFTVYILKAFQKTSELVDENAVSCHQLAFSKRIPSHFVVIVELISSSLLPMTVIGVTSYEIIKILWCPQAKQKPGTNLAILRSRRQVTKLVVSVALAFDVFWLPWAVWLVLNLTGTITVINYDKKAFFILLLLQLSNAACNPVLYSIQSRNFRQKLAKMLCAKCQKHEKKMKK